MKINHQRKKNRTVKFFSPDAVQTRIAQALNSDLSTADQAYGGVEDATLLLINRQLSEFSKKYSSLEKSQDALVDKTFKKFLEVNQHMSSFLEGFYAFPESAQGCILSTDNAMDSILRRARSFMHYILTDFTEDEWFHHCKNGGGSSIGVSFRDTSLEAKSSWPVSLTSSIKPLMDRYLVFDPQLKAAIEDFNSDNPVTGKYKEVQGSRATTVEKNDTIRRMIAVEPTGNMFFQQGLMMLMYNRMRKVGLDVDRLPFIHKERARVASITSQEATIDFSSASDCVSTPLLRYLMPPKWFHSLDLVRCKFMEVNHEQVHLNMFSTMGNAGTFPVETLVFYTLALSCYYQFSGNRSLLFDEQLAQVVSVFGDDCIVPTPCAPLFMEVCTKVGFIVNREKSFFDPEPGFRESCGGDYLRGYDVRPFHLKAPTSTRKSALEPWLYIIGNGLLKKYRKCFGDRDYIYDKALWREFVSMFRENGLKIKLVPSYFPDDAGFKISDDLERFNRHYAPIFSGVSVTKSGTVKFSYCRFLYRDHEDRFDHLHYAVWLKRSSVTEVKRLSHLSLGSREPMAFRSSRRKGGYIVASAISAHWVVPNLG